MDLLKLVSLARSRSCHVNLIATWRSTTSGFQPETITGEPLDHGHFVATIVSKVLLCIIRLFMWITTRERKSR